jgi:riboflavin biosynthesis pyrimidine reductase
MADPAPRFQQLLPQGAPGELEAAPLLDEMFAALSPPAGRPLTLVNFVASTDGRATVEGRSRGLGDDGDRSMFHGLRERVDAVTAGPMTMRVERYGRILRAPERRERRLARGQSAEPLACLVSRSGRLPTDIPLFGCPEARVIVFAPATARADLDGLAAQVEHVALEPDSLTLPEVARRLRADFGVATLLCEGGPTLFSALLAEGLVDELFLTLAPLLVGGGLAAAITSGAPLPEPVRLRLLWLLEREGSLFARYGLG